MPRSRRSRYTAEYRRLLSMLVVRRERAKVTQVTLAQKLKTSQSMLSKIERGVVRIDLIDLFAYLDGIGEDTIAFMKDFKDARDNAEPRRRRF